MKRILAIFFLLASFSILAQQPIMRNAMSTNIAGTPVLSVNNLSVTNSVAGGSTNWLFYGILPSTVARLSDISSPTSGITSAQATNIVIALGTNWFILQTNGYGTNTILVNPILTNGINYAFPSQHPFSSQPDPSLGFTGTEQFGRNSAMDGNSSTLVGSSTLGVGNFQTIIGSTIQSTTDGNYGVGIGYDAHLAQLYGIVIGSEARLGTFGMNPLHSVVIGGKAEGWAEDEVNIGYLGYNEGNFSINIGANSYIPVLADYGIAIGNLSSVSNTYNIAIGYNSDVGADYGIGIGANTIATNINAIAFGYSARTEKDFQIKMGTITNIVTIPGYLEIPQNAALNRVWSCTNATTGGGTWVALSPPPPSPPTDYVTNNNGWGTNMVDWGTNFTSMSNLNVGGSLYVSNGVWITNIDNLAQLLYVNSAGSNLSAYIGTNSFFAGGSGDVNGSGAISGADVTLVNNYLNGTTILNSDRFARANISGDGIVSGTDAFYLQQVVLGNMTIENAKYFMRRMRGRSMSVDTNGHTRFGYVSGGHSIPFLGLVDIDSKNTTNPPALFVINTNKFFVGTDGWVGIGTNLPQAALHVYSNSIFDGSVQLGWVTGSKLAEFDVNRRLTNSPYSSTELTNPLATTTYADTKQYGSANLTNWSGVATSAVLYPWGGQWGSTTLSNLAATGALTNVNEVQYGCANLTNWCQISTNDFISGTTVSNAIAAQTYGQTWYVWGSSNVTSVTNYLGTNYKAMQKSDVTLSATANTNVYVNPSVNDYIGEVITAIPAGISSITPGDITSVSFAFISGGGSMSLLAEVYIRTNLLAYTNSNEREIGVGPTFALSTSLAAYQTAIPITTNVSLSTTNYLVRKLKVVSKSGTPNVSLVSQGAYPARVTFPIGSASFVLKSGDTMSGSLVMNSGQFIGNGAGLTNIPFSAITNRNTYSTNAALNGATINLDGGMYQRTNAAGAITFTGLSGVENDKAKGVTLFIETITAGADVTVTIPASWRNKNVATALYVTNGWTGILSVQAYGSYMTNCAFLLVK